MAKSHSFSLAFFAISAAAAVILVAVSSSPTVVAAGGDTLMGTGWVVPRPPHCKGTIAECLEREEEDDADEFELDSEINRRILADTTKYIGYGALRRNTVPCSQRGASYYNCRPGAQANPYSRGCSAIARCRGG